MSKTFRLTEEAKKIFAETEESEVDLLDLSVLAAEYGRIIFPCKACVSTAMPLCHWPCKPESLPRSGAGLDARDLSTLGVRARHHDYQAGALVSGAQCVQVDDGSARLCRLWKS